MKHTSIALTILLTAGIPSVHAEDSFGRKVNALSQYKSDLTRLEAFKNKVLASDEGTLALIQQDNQKLKQWILRFRGDLQAALDALAAGGTYPAFLNTVESVSVRGQQDIRVIYSEFFEKKSSITKLAADMGRPVVDYSVPGFGSEQETFEGIRSSIFTSLNDSLDENDKIFRDIMNVYPDFIEIFKVKARNVLIQRNIDTIDAKVQEIGAALNRAKTLAPYLEAVKVNHSKFTAAYLALDYFSMKSQLDKLTTSCQVYFAFLDGNPQINNLSAKDRPIIDRLCKGAQEDYNTLVTDSYAGNLRQIVADATTYYRVPAVKDYCRTVNAGKYNCNFYKWAGKFSTDDILKMTDKQLQDYEDLWAAILKNKE